MEKEEKIIQVLKASKDPLKVGEIADKTGLDKKEVDTCIKGLKTAGKIQSPNRCYWTVS